MIIVCIFGLGFFVFLALVAFWAAALKGTKSCRTQGDFRLSIRLFVRSFVPPRPSYQGLQASNLASETSNLASQASNSASQASDRASQALNLASQASNLTSQASDLASQTSNLASQASNPTS